MLNVSEKAANAPHRTLEQQEAEDIDVLRLSRDKGILELAVGKESDGDQLVSHEGRTVLAIDSGLPGELDGAIFDLVDTPEGPRLTLSAPGR